MEITASGKPAESVVGHGLNLFQTALAPKFPRREVVQAHSVFKVLDRSFHFGVLAAMSLQLQGAALAFGDEEVVAVA